MRPACRISADILRVAMAFAIIGQVLIILAASVVAGELFEQFELPGIAGALLAGLALGPTLLGIITPTAQLSGIESIALFFIMFFIGMGMSTQLITRNASRSMPLILTSFILPLLAVAAVAYLSFGFGATASFVVAMGITVPSISIVSVLARRYGMLTTKTGYLVISSVIITDILAFSILIALSRHPPSNAAFSLVGAALLVAAFLLAEKAARRYFKAFNSALRHVRRVFRSSNFAYGVLMVFGFLIAALFNYIGITYIIGAFFAGMITHSLISNTAAYGKVLSTFGRITDGFFIPVFFGIAGASAILNASDISLRMAVGMAAAVAATVAISYKLTVRFAARSMPDRRAERKRQVASMLCARGAVGVAIAIAALNSALISGLAYSVIIFVTVVIAIVASVLLRNSHVGRTASLSPQQPKRPPGMR